MDIDSPEVIQAEREERAKQMAEHVHKIHDACHRAHWAVATGALSLVDLDYLAIRIVEVIISARAALLSALLLNTDEASPELRRLLRQLDE